MVNNLDIHQPPFRFSIVIAGLLAILVTGAFGLYGNFAIAVGACGGDGGQTYAEQGSPRNHLCETVGGKLRLIEFPGVPVIALISTVLACMRRRFSTLAFGVGLAVLAFLTPMAVLSSAAEGCKEHYYDSNECVRYG